MSSSLSSLDHMSLMRCYKFFAARVTFSLHSQSESQTVREHTLFWFPSYLFSSIVFHVFGKNYLKSSNIQIKLLLTSDNDTVGPLVLT